MNNLHCATIIKRDSRVILSVLDEVISVSNSMKNWFFAVSDGLVRDGSSLSVDNAAEGVSYSSS